MRLLPVAVTLKVALFPAHTVALAGCEEITVKSVTDNTAALEVKLEGQALLTITLYLLLFIVAVTALKFRVAVIAPGIFVNVLPPSVLTCH